MIYDKGNYNVHIWDLIHSKSIRSFGIQGEGPGEFDGYEKLFVHQGKIYFYYGNKIKVFDVNGQLIKHIKVEMANIYNVYGKNNRIYRLMYKREKLVKTEYDLT